MDDPDPTDEAETSHEPTLEPTVNPTGVVRTRREQWQAGNRATADDELAGEEPLEIRVANVPLAVLMRTPGHDEELVRGFLVTEGIVRDADDIANVRPCPNIDREDAEGNVMLVRLAADVDVDIARFRRNLYASSSCGVCGKESIERAMAVAASLGPMPALAPERIPALPDELRAQQSLFARTGAVHAAGLVDATSRLVAVREDVGRHNAVDKVVGWSLVQNHSAPPLALVVSGRVSFEIVQKALAARVPTIVAVSAPTSLAVALAKRANITLIGFVRGDGFAVYAGGVGRR